MQFVTDYCCDRHENGFELQAFLPGTLFLNDTPLDFHKSTSQATTVPKRSNAQKKELTKCLKSWCLTTHKNSKLTSVRPAYYILSDVEVKTLIGPVARTLDSIDAVTNILQQSTEWKTHWANGILGIIQDYNRMLSAIKKKQTTRKTQPVVVNTVQDENLPQPTRTRKALGWRMHDMDERRTDKTLVMMIFYRTTRIGLKEEESNV